MSQVESVGAAQMYGLECTPLARVESLRNVIVDGGDRAQEMRRLPDDCVDVLIDAGMFRFTLPPELGGENASSIQTIEVLEAISAIDASVGWNVMLGSEINAMAAGGMEQGLAKEIYLDDPRVIMCGGGGTGSIPATAVRQPDGGLLVTGEATFLSGCWNAEWALIPAPEVEEGQDFSHADFRTMQMRLMHRSEWEILDTWDVAGLRGSGSHTVKAERSRVRPEHADVDLFVVPPLYDNPVFRIPIPLRLSYNKVAIALGIARGALDAFVDLAHNKVPMLSPSKLQDRPIAQIRVGEFEGKFRAARPRTPALPAWWPRTCAWRSSTSCTTRPERAPPTWPTRSSESCATPMAPPRTAGSRTRCTRTSVRSSWATRRRPSSPGPGAPASAPASAER